MEFCTSLSKLVSPALYFWKLSETFQGVPFLGLCSCKAPLHPAARETRTTDKQNCNVGELQHVNHAKWLRQKAIITIMIDFPQPRDGSSDFYEVAWAVCKGHGLVKPGNLPAHGWVHAQSKRRVHVMYFLGACERVLSLVKQKKASFQGLHEFWVRL